MGISPIVRGLTRLRGLKKTSASVFVWGKKAGRLSALIVDFVLLVQPFLEEFLSLGL
jgi:hypothetical protein